MPNTALVLVASLRNRGLIRVIQTDDDRPQRVVITSEGMTAIGVETEDDAPEGATPGDRGATSADAGVQAAEAPPTGADDAAAPAKRKSKAKAAERGKAAWLRSPRPARAPSRPK